MNIGNNRYDNVRLTGKFKDVIRRLSIIAIELVAGLFGVAMLAFAILWWPICGAPDRLAPIATEPFYLSAASLAVLLPCCFALPQNCIF